MAIRGIQCPTKTPLETCAEIVSKGAILTLPGVPLVRLLVGEFRGVAGNLALVFPAFAESSDDVQAIAFDELRVHPFGACFVERGRIHGLLAAIDKSGVEDPDDYRVAWSLWQDVLPMRRPLIESGFALVSQERGLPTREADMWQNVSL